MKQLFNPNGSDTYKNILESDITNILDLSSVKHEVFISLWEKAYSNNWIPQKVSNMSKDKYDYYNKLTKDERYAFDQIISFLIYLDSIQTNNLPSIADKVTSPELVFFIARQTADEAVHSFSYGYILKNLMTKEEYRKIIYAWRENPIALERNKYIAELYEVNRTKYNDKKAFLVLAVANFLLEGLYFYNGFNYFHNLSYRGLMVNSNIQINYIKRDENVHCAAFLHILNIYKQEFPEYWDEDLIRNMFTTAVEQEIKFSVNIIGDKVEGMSTQDIKNYTYWLANKRLKELKIEPIFPESVNPYKHLDMIASIDDETTNKVNQFEARSINYKDPSIFKGWENI